MIYLTGRNNLHDDSDYEDPCDQFAIPSNSNAVIDDFCHD